MNRPPLREGRPPSRIPPADRDLIGTDYGESIDSTPITIRDRVVIGICVAIIAAIAAIVIGDAARFF